MDDDNGGLSPKRRTVSDCSEDAEDWCVISRDDVATDDSDSVEILSEGRRSSISLDEAEALPVILSRPASSLSDELTARFEAEETSKDKNEKIFIYLGISFLIVGGVVALRASDDYGIGSIPFSRTKDDFTKDFRYDAMRSAIRSLQENSNQMRTILTVLEKAIVDQKRVSPLPELRTNSIPQFSRFEHSDGTLPRPGNEAPSDDPAMNAARKNALLWNDALLGVKNEVNAIRKNLYYRAYESATSVKNNVRNDMCKSKEFLGSNACSCFVQRDIFFYRPDSTHSEFQHTSVLDTIEASLLINVNKWRDFIVSSLDDSLIKIIGLIEIGVDKSFKNVYDEISASLSYKTKDGDPTEKTVQTPTEQPVSVLKEATPEVVRNRNGRESPPQSGLRTKIVDDRMENEPKKEDARQPLKGEPAKRPKSPEEPRPPTKKPDKRSDNKTKRQRGNDGRETSKKEGRKMKKRVRDKNRGEQQKNGSFLYKNFRWLKKGLKYVAHRGKKERDSMVASLKLFYKKHGSGLMDKINSYFTGVDSLFKPLKDRLFKNDRNSKQRDRKDDDDDDEDDDDWKKSRKIERKERRERGKRHKRQSTSKLKHGDGYYSECLSRSDDGNYTEASDDDFNEKQPQPASWFVKMGKHRAELRVRDVGGDEDWWIRRARARRGRTR